MSLAVSFNQDVTLAVEELARRGSQPTAARILPFCLELDGDVPADILEDALNAVVERHSALRTSYHPAPNVLKMDRDLWLRVFSNCGLGVSGLYTQTVMREASRLKLPLLDCALPLSSEIQDELRSNLLQPFDYTSPPLLRACLLRIDNSKYLLALALSALVFDLWSLQVLRRDLIRAYQEREGLLIVRMETPFQFHQFVRWQRREAESGHFDVDVDYWRQGWEKNQRFQIWRRDLPSEVITPSRLVSRTERFRLSSEDSRRLRAYASEFGTGVRSVLFAIFCARWGTVTGKSRIAMQVSFDNRLRPEHLGAIGWFANTHLVGIDLPPGASSSDLVQRSRDVLIEADDHQGVPAAFLWKKLGRVPEHSDVGLSFTFFFAPGMRSALASPLLFRPVPLPQIHGWQASAGMSLLAVDSEEGLLLAVSYSPDRFNSEFVSALVRDMKGTLLRMAETCPKRLAHG